MHYWFWLAFENFLKFSYCWGLRGVNCYLLKNSDRSRTDLDHDNRSKLAQRATVGSELNTIPQREPWTTVASHLGQDPHRQTPCGWERLSCPLWAGWTQITESPDGHNGSFTKSTRSKWSSRMLASLGQSAPKDDLHGTRGQRKGILPPIQTFM